MKSSKVRELARRYAAGELSQENYRNQRRALIKDIVSGAQPLSYRDDSAASPAHHGHAKLLAALIIAALVVGIASGIAWKNGFQHKDKQTSKAASVPAAPAPDLSPGPELIHGFVETNDWTDTSLDDFVRRWSVLSSLEQTKARSSLLYPRLVSAVHQQITSEKAIASMGNPGETDEHLLHLQKLAQTLGINAKN